MTAAEWVGLIAGLIAILGAFVAALRWTVHQFVQEISVQLFQRMDRLESDISVLSNRQSDIYAKLMSERGSHGSKNKGAKVSKPARKRTSRKEN
jgi:LPS O-antigen subunit length determinant protein (WzzB/FepE family)